MNYYRLPRWESQMGSPVGTLYADLSGTFAVMAGSQQESSLIAAGATQVEKPGSSAESFGGMYPAASLTYGAIMDAFNAAKKSNSSSGTVLLPDGMLSTVGSGPLPYASGIAYRGAGYFMSYSAAPDSAGATPAGGTWLLGDGTFPAFGGNSTDGSAPYGTQKAFSNAGLSGIGLFDLGVSNFSHGAKIGSNYNPGGFYSSFENICALNCGWGWWFENMIHSHYGLKTPIGAINCSLGGIRFRSSSSTAILNPVNCTVGEILATVPAGNPLARGIVISCANGTPGGLSAAAIVQCNRFSPGTGSQTATTNGTTTIAVADTSKYMVGMPVAFSALGGATGIVVNQIYFIVNIVTNTSVQIANAPGGSAISPAAGTPTLTTQGMPCLELVSEDSTTGNVPYLSFVQELDLEAGGTCKALVHQASGGIAWGALGIGSSGSTQDICFRAMNNAPAFLESAQSINVDVSDGTVNLFYRGGPGFNTNSVLGAAQPTGITGTLPGNRKLNISQFSPSSFHNVQPVADAEWTKPDLAWGQLTQNYPSAGNITLTAQLAGCISFKDAGATTKTLPVITSTNYWGLGWEIANDATSGGAMTLSAGTGQSFNNKSTLTSLTLNAGASVSVRANYNSGAPFYQITGIGGTYSAGTISSV